jgi:hypothetical protein
LKLSLSSRTKFGKRASPYNRVASARLDPGSLPMDEDFLVAGIAMVLQDSLRLKLLTPITNLISSIMPIFCLSKDT